jgi:ubiquinol-cytochrome c reductase subunit 6
MGIVDFFSDLYSSMGFPEAHADAPPEDKEDGDSKEGGDGDGEGDEKAEGGDEEAGEAGGDEEAGEEEPEEEEEEEPVDPKPKLEEGEFNWAIYFQFCFNSG